MGKKNGGKKQIAKIMLITAIVTLISQLVGLLKTLVEWLSGN